MPIASIVPEFPAGTYHYTGTAIVSKASAPLTPVQKTSMRQAESLSVGKTWSRMDHRTWQGQIRTAPILALVKAFRTAHDDAQDTTVRWPNAEESA